MNPRQILFQAVDSNYRYKILKKQNMRCDWRRRGRLSILIAQGQCVTNRIVETRAAHERRARDASPQRATQAHRPEAASRCRGRREALSSVRRCPEFLLVSDSVGKGNIAFFDAHRISNINHRCNPHRPILSPDASRSVEHGSRKGSPFDPAPSTGELLRDTTGSLGCPRFPARRTRQRARKTHVPHRAPS